MVYILLADGFEEMEGLIPADLLRRTGREIKLVGLKSREVTGGHGIVVRADMTLDEVDGNQMEMLVLPGGLVGVANLESEPAVLALIQRAAAAEDCWLCAICAAPRILAGLGLLDGKNAVCYPSEREKMAQAVLHMDEEVVTEGRIVTSLAAGTAFPFGLKLVEVLEGKEKAEEIRNAICYRTTKDTASR